MAAAAPLSPAATLAGLLALGAHALPPLQVPTAAPRTLYGRLIAGDAGFWAAFLQGPHMPHGLTYFQPLSVAFVTDAGGIAELLAWRMDAHGALRHVGWSEAAVAEWGRGRLVKLVAFEAQAQQAPPPATWDTVLFTALPAAAAAAATTAAAGSASVWSAAAAENSRFVSVLQQGRALVEKAVAWPQRSASVSEFLAGHDAGAPDWGCARRVLSLTLWLDDLYQGTGRTLKVDGSQGCAEFLAPSSLPPGEHAAVLDFAVAPQQ